MVKKIRPDAVTTFTWSGEDVKPKQTINQNKPKKAQLNNESILAKRVRQTGIGLFGLFMAYNVGRCTIDKLTNQSSESIELNQNNKNDLENKVYHFSPDQLAIANNEENIVKKHNAYEHNSDIIIEAAKRFAKEYAILPGKFQNPNTLLEESITQMYQESGLQQTWLNGNIMKSKQNALGAGQFLGIGIDDVNQKLKDFQKKYGGKYEFIETINKNLAQKPTKEGAIENVRANVLYKKLNLERLGSAQVVNAEYHQGATNLKKAKKRAKSNNPQKFLKRIGPHGKNYIKKIEQHKKIYETIDQFADYATDVKATSLMNYNLEEAKSTNSINKKIELYEQIIEFSNVLKQENDFDQKKQLKQATFELAKLYQNSNPDKAYNLAQNIIQETKDSSEKIDRFYFKNANYIANRTSR